MTALESWVRNVRAVLDGQSRSGFIRLGRTPVLLRRLGLLPGDLVMSAGKIVRVRSDHPEISGLLIERLPMMLADPAAAFPSAKRDGSLIVVVDSVDQDGCPVIVPIVADAARQINVVLSVYGKQAGDAWIAREIATARSSGQPYYVKTGSADAEPKPGSAEAVPSPPGPIPAGGPTKPVREILTVVANVKT